MFVISHSSNPSQAPEIHFMTRLYCVTTGYAGIAGFSGCVIITCTGVHLRRIRTNDFRVQYPLSHVTDVQVRIQILYWSHQSKLKQLLQLDFYCHQSKKFGESETAMTACLIFVTSMLFGLVTFLLHVTHASPKKNIQVFKFCFCPAVNM